MNRLYCPSPFRKILAVVQDGEIVAAQVQDLRRFPGYGGESMWQIGEEWFIDGLHNRRHDDPNLFTGMFEVGPISMARRTGRVWITHI